MFQILSSSSNSRIAFNSSIEAQRYICDNTGLFYNGEVIAVINLETQECRFFKAELTMLIKPLDQQ